MKGDFSRLTFAPEKHYDGVRMQQGRVLLDADWNEEHDILTHRTETGTRDVVGRCGAPEDDAGFHIVEALSDLSEKEQRNPGNRATVENGE